MATRDYMNKEGEQVPKIDDEELDVLNTFEKGRLKSVATKTELAKFKAVARATALKDRRVSIHLPEANR